MHTVLLLAVIVWRKKLYVASREHWPDYVARCLSSLKTIKFEALWTVTCYTLWQKTKQKKNKWGQLCTRTATPSWHIHWKGASDTSVNKMLFKSSNNKGRTRQKSGYSVLIVTQWSVIFTGCKLACREQWYMCSAWDRDALETIGQFFPNSSETKLVTCCAYVMSGFVRFALVQSSSSPCRATFLLPCKYHFVLRAILHELPMHLNYHTPFFI